MLSCTCDKEFYGLLDVYKRQVMDGRLFSRNEIKKIYYLHKGSIRNYEQVKFIYSNGEEYQFPGSNEWREDELRQTEVSNLLHKICPVVIENAEDRCV